MSGELPSSRREELLKTRQELIDKIEVRLEDANDLLHTVSLIDSILESSDEPKDSETGDGNED